MTWEFKNQVEHFLLRRATWFLFFIIILAIAGGLFFFYFNAWLPVNTDLLISPKVDLPINQALWRSILDEINRRHLLKGEVQEIKDIFK